MLNGGSIIIQVLLTLLYVFVCSVPDTFGLLRHRTDHDRQITHAGEWSRVVMEKPQHGKSQSATLHAYCPVFIGFTVV